MIFSCHNNDSILPINNISLEYNGKVITFDDVKIEEDDLDLDAGKGLRAYCTTSELDENNSIYYVIIDFKKEALNKYSFHKINFGIKRKLIEGTFKLQLYYAELTNGYNKTNFQTNISLNASELKGSFSGSLISLNAPEILINGGKYSLNLNTVKSY